MHRKCSFKFLTEERINELKKLKMKCRSEAKLKWAANAYCEWQQARLEEHFDQNIWDTSLNELQLLTKVKLEYSRCLFVPEVTKSKGDGPYPGKKL